MIKSVTFQGASNFKSNLYALEIKSRFVNQQNADGYYAGYGNELAATVVNNVITIGTGAFLVQGRMLEIDTTESVDVPIENGKVGYVCARIETYRPSDMQNCSLVVHTGPSLSQITLTKQDTYSAAAEISNRIYELPLYSFTMSGGGITNLVKVISPVSISSGANGTDGKDGADGRGISNAEINSSGELVLTFTDGKTQNLGIVVGADGADGTGGQNSVDIPSPTSADEGKFLIVQNGKYTLVTFDEVGIEIKSGLRNKLGGATLDTSPSSGTLATYQYKYTGTLSSITCSANGTVTTAATISITQTGLFSIDAKAAMGSGSGTVTVTATFADGTIDTDTFYVNYNYACLTGDSLILMADGTEKRIDSLSVGDKVLSFNPASMKLEADEITYSDSKENKTHTEYDIWTFSDGTQVKTVHRHRLYNIERQTMAYMDEWAIGEHAYGRNGNNAMLVAHETRKEPIKHYTIFTKNQNYFVNGLLAGNRYTKSMALGGNYDTDKK